MLLLRFRTNCNSLVAPNNTDNEAIRMEDEWLQKIPYVATRGRLSYSSGAYRPSFEYRLYSGCGGLHSLTALDPSMKTLPSSFRNGRSMVSSAKQRIVCGTEFARRVRCLVKIHHIVSSRRLTFTK
jgi:hypothetical protein